MNFFLSRASQVEDESVRLEYEGLTRFFRAYFYFEKSNAMAMCLGWTVRWVRMKKNCTKGVIRASRLWRK